MGRRHLLLALVVGACAGTTVVVPSGAASAQQTSVLGTLRSGMIHALAGSTAHETAFRADIAGLGTIGLGVATPLRPASNNKLFVAETALQQLTPAFRYETGVYASTPVQNGVIDGWLGIRASGDPTLTSANLVALAHDLYRLGLRRVTGNLLLDDSSFALEHTAPGWKAGFVPDDCGPISGFAVDENSWRQDAHYILHPDMGNLSLWRTILKQAGITVLGTNDVAPFATSLPPLVQHRSGPVGAIVREMVTNSDNFIAEMLLEELGLARGGYGDRQNGLTAVQAEAQTLHVRLVDDVDGSGLSYDDRESPDVLVDWLEAVMGTSSGQMLKEDLPVACQTGTLEFRMCSSGVRGRVEAKTGTLDGVHTLSGFTTTRAGQGVVFSILLSGTTDDLRAIAAIDRAVAVLATTND